MCAFSFWMLLLLQGHHNKVPTMVITAAEKYGLTVLEAKDQGTAGRSLPSELQLLLLEQSPDVPFQKDTVILDQGLPK